jgi:hypothetical protein
MAEPTADHIDLHTRFEQVHGGRVPRSVGRDPPCPLPSGRVEARRMATDDPGSWPRGGSAVPRVYSCEYGTSTIVDGGEIAGFVLVAISLSSLASVFGPAMPSAFALFAALEGQLSVVPPRLRHLGAEVDQRSREELHVTALCARSHGRAPRGGDEPRIRPEWRVKQHAALSRTPWPNLPWSALRSKVESVFSDASVSITYTV